MFSLVYHSIGFFPRLISQLSLFPLNILSNRFFDHSHLSAGNSASDSTSRDLFAEFGVSPPGSVAPSPNSQIGLSKDTDMADSTPNSFGRSISSDGSSDNEFKAAQLIAKKDRLEVTVEREKNRCLMDFIYSLGLTAQDLNAFVSKGIPPRQVDDNDLVLLNVENLSKGNDDVVSHQKVEHSLVNADAHNVFVDNPQRVLASSAGASTVALTVGSGIPGKGVVGKGDSLSAHPVPGHFDGPASASGVPPHGLGAGTHATKPTWSSVVTSVSMPRATLKFFPPTEINGRISIKPPVSVLRKGRSRWNNSLVGYFHHSRLPFKVVEPVVRKLWGTSGLSKVLLHPKGYFIFTFNSAEDRDNILALGPWYISNRQIILKPWKEGIDVTREVCNKAPIWVKMHNVRYSYWSEEGLSYIASGIGNPLFLDNETAKLVPLPYARVCVEIDVGALMPKSLPVVFLNENDDIDDEQSVEVSVEYQNIPPSCLDCKTFGHSLLKCPKANFQWKPKSGPVIGPAIAPSAKLETAAKSSEPNISTLPVQSSMDGSAGDKDGWVTVGKNVGMSPIPVDVNVVTSSNLFEVLAGSVDAPSSGDSPAPPNPLTDKLKMIDEKEGRDIKLKARSCIDGGQSSKKKSKRGGGKSPNTPTPG